MGVVKVAIYACRLSLEMGAKGVPVFRVFYGKYILFQTNVGYYSTVTGSVR